jgi:GntR family transcriptional regulator, glc operon transcriptional activator
MVGDTVPGYQLVARRLEDLVLNGTFQPGKRLPSERQLAQRLKQSRPLIREALKELRGRGVIETKHGKGSFVTDMICSASADTPLSHLFRDHSRTLYDLLEVREVLEGQAAYLAARHATPTDKYRIANALEAMKRPTAVIDEAENHACLDYNFHRSIAEASHNPVLVHTLKNLSNVIINSVLASVSRSNNRPEQKMMIGLQHHDIFNAVMQSDPEKAKIAASKHIREAYNRLRDFECRE